MPIGIASSFRFPRERRKQPRYRLSPMYSSVIVEPKAVDSLPMLGHVYDISENGVRVELDEPLLVGEQVRVNLSLPGSVDDIRAKAQVRWVHDADDDPGPRRMALQFSEFLSPVDRLRLKAYIASGVRRDAA